MTNDFEGGDWGEGVPTGNQEGDGLGGPSLYQPQDPLTAAPQSGYQPGAQDSPYPQQDGQQQNQQQPYQPQQPYQAQPYGGAPMYVQATQDSGAQTALIVSIISLVVGFFCGIGFLGSPVGMIMGRKAMQAIDRGEANPADRTTATIAFVIGIIGTVFIAFAVLGLLFLLVVGFGGLAAGSVEG